MMMLRGLARRQKKEKAPSQSPGNVDSVPTLLTLSNSIDDGERVAYGQRGIVSPPRGEHAVTCKEAVKSVRCDGFSKHLDSKQGGKAKMLVFLYGRGFYADQKKKERQKKIKTIIESPAASERLLQIIDFPQDDNVTAGHKSLYVNNSLVLQHYFEQEGTFGFLKDMTKAKFFFRIQKHGNCFLHAPCIMASYLGQKLGYPNLPPVDVTKCVRRSFSDEDLYNFVVHDDGGSSVGMLIRILEIFNDKPEDYVQDSGCSLLGLSEYNLEEEMLNRGPALVHKFETKKRFTARNHPQGKVGYLRFDGDPARSRGEFVEVKPKENQKEEIEIDLQEYVNKMGKESGGSRPCPRNLDSENAFGSSPADDEEALTSFDDEAVAADAGRKKKDNGTHAMVLIGGRRDKNNTKKNWLLLQNWWDDMQLVEVSDDYFMKCSGRLAFVLSLISPEGSELKLEKCYSTNDARVADSHNIDRAENPTGGLCCVESRDRAS